MRKPTESKDEHDHEDEDEIFNRRNPSPDRVINMHYKEPIQNMVPL